LGTSHRHVCPVSRMMAVQPFRRDAKRSKGLMLKALLADLLPPSNQAWTRYWYRRVKGSLRGLDTLLPYVRPGSVAIDVGAHVGVFAYGLARRGATVHAFEPQPRCAA